MCAFSEGKEQDKFFISCSRKKGVFFQKVQIIF